VWFRLWKERAGAVFHGIPQRDISWQEITETPRREIAGLHRDLEDAGICSG